MALLDDPGTQEGPASPEALIPEARELQRRRLRRRWGAVLLGLLILAGGGIVLFGGGGGAAVPTVGGPLPAGIAARVADPEGGLAWGLRVVRASGWTCVQLGRLRGGQLGVIGRDGSFGNDGRFHPFGPSTTNQAYCAQTDGAGHAFLTIQLGALPASGVGAGFRTASACRTAAEIAHMRQSLRGRRVPRLPRGFIAQQVVCPGGDLRFIQYGLLGPEATGLTYVYDGHREVERTGGPDGAYVVVGPATPAFCEQLPRNGFCGASGSAPSSLFGGMILAVNYRDGHTCQPATLGTRLPPFVVQCPRGGYIAPKPFLRESQAAAPVSFHLIEAQRYCLRPGSGSRYGFGSAVPTDLGLYLPCNGPLTAADRRPGQTLHGLLVVFSWTARRPVMSRNAEYEYFLGSDRCGGQGGATYGRITAGERLTRGIVVPTRCKGRLTGSVAYVPNVGPGGGYLADHDLGRDGSVLVGSFTFSIP